MPFKSSQIKLSEAQDRRRKLTTEQYREIRDLYSTGRWSLNGLAKEYGVSKKLILLIVNPESKAKNDAYRKSNWREFQGTKEEHATAIRETRRYKQRLYLAGELEESR